MYPTHVQRVVFVERPNGPLNPDRVFRVESVPFDARVGEGEALVQTIYVSVDSGFRAFLNEGIVGEMSIGEVMRAPGVGVIKEVGEKTPGLSVGDVVFFRPGWRDWGVFKADTLKVLHPPRGVELIDFLGILGFSGLCAYIGIVHIARVKPGEIVVVSSAAGAVGLVTCQTAKIFGARVIGVAGSEAKCELLEKEFGVDKALNYRNPGFSSELLSVGGADVYFDNVGGELLDLMMTRMNQFGRIVLCGSLSRLDGGNPGGLENYGSVILKSLKIQGFYIPHYASLFESALEHMARWIAEGKLKRKFIVLDSLAQAPNALAGMFDANSGSIGKTVIQLAEARFKEQLWPPT